jgi:hypothetical protein
MLRARRLIGVMAAVAAFGCGARASEQAERLLAMFAGTYDTGAQVGADIAAGVAPERRHERRRVVYARIAVPQIGPYVLFRQESHDGAVIARGLAVFEDDGAAVRMWLRQIPDAARFADLHRRPELWPAVSFDPAYGGKCPFHWHATGDGFLGTLDGGRCDIVSNAGKPMSFVARWELSATALSILDNTYDGDGRLMSGRDDDQATRYDRVAP